MSEPQPLSWPVTELSPEQRKELLIREVLDYASSGNLVPFIENVVNGKLDIDQKDGQGFAVIHLAVLQGKFEFVQNLLDKAACPVDLPTLSNQTPLALACSKGYINTIKMLLDRGASIEHRDDFGLTPLLCSIQYGQIPALLLIINRGGNIEAEDKEGNGVVHWAAYRNQVSMLRVLKAIGVDLNKKDTSGRNALHRAAVTNSWKASEFLLFNNIKADEKDSKGRSAYDVAVEYKSTGVATLINNYSKDGGPLFTYFSYIFVLYWTGLYYIYYSYLLEHTSYKLIPSLGFNFCVLWILPLFILCKVVKCSTIDPNRVESEPSITENLTEKDYENVQDFTDVCPTCRIRRVQRSKHCRFIDKCVLEYDHYCYFLGRTIGKGNKKIFFFGLFVHYLAIALFLYICWSMLDDRVLGSGYLSTYCGRLVAELWKLENEVKGTIFLSICVWWYCLWYLAVVVYSISQGLTVNEVLNRSRYRYLYVPYLALDDTVKMQFKNPFTKGIYTNFLEFIIN